MSFLKKVEILAKGAAIEVMVAPNVWKTVDEQPSSNINSVGIREDLKKLQKEHPDKQFRIVKR